MNFVAFDFETANRQRASACSLALTIVRDNQIADQFYSLINPETDFDWRNTQIHGLTAVDVKDAPNFAELWEHINDIFKTNRLVVAHNASFDNSVLKHSLERYEIELPHYMSLDTLKTSKKFYPDLKNHKLNTLCDEFNIPLEHHHNALDDSVACANILLYEQQVFGTQALIPFVKTV